MSNIGSKAETPSGRCVTGLAQAVNKYIQNNWGDKCLVIDLNIVINVKLFIDKVGTIKNGNK